MTNATERLRTLHEELEDLFHEISWAKDEATKRLIFEDIVASLTAQAALEAALLHTPTESSTRRPYLDRLVADLRMPAVSPQTFDAKILTLQEEVERGIDELELVAGAGYLRRPSGVFLDSGVLRDSDLPGASGVRRGAADEGDFAATA